MAFGFLPLNLFSGAAAGTTVGAAAGVGAANAAGRTIAGAVGAAAGIGIAAGAAQATGVVSTTGNAAGVGVASAVSGGATDVWGFGAPAFAAFTFGGPQLPDVATVFAVATASAAGVGIAAAASSSVGIISTVGNASGIGRAAAAAASFTTTGHASGVGEARGHMANATPSIYAPWPGALPQCPILAQWTEKQQGNVLTFKPEVGPAKYRRNKSSQQYVSEAVFRMDNDQLSMFNDFYESTLQDGSLLFLWDHPITKASYTWSFSESPTITRMTPNSNQVQCKLVRI